MLWIVEWLFYLTKPKNVFVFRLLLSILIRFQRITMKHDVKNVKREKRKENGRMSFSVFLCFCPLLRDLLSHCQTQKIICSFLQWQTQKKFFKLKLKTFFLWNSSLLNKIQSGLIGQRHLKPSKCFCQKLQQNALDSSMNNFVEIKLFRSLRLCHCERPWININQPSYQLCLLFTLIISTWKTYL